MTERGTLTLSLRGTVLSAGSDWGEAIGRSSGDLTLRSFSDLLTPDGAEHVAARLDRLAAGERGSDHLTMMLRHIEGHGVRAEIDVSRAAHGRGPGSLDLELVDLPAKGVPARGAVHAAWRHRNLRLFAQAIRDVDTMAAVRQELLVRMVSADGDLIPAARFLPVMERLGLLADLDRWVVVRAVRMLGDGWLADTPLEINVSAHSVRDPDPLLAMLELELAASGVAAERLMLACPASALELGAGVVEDFAHRLHDIGCLVALDHLGASPAELDAIASLPVDTVKIGGSLVHRALSDDQAGDLDRVVAAARRASCETVGGAVDGADVLGTLRRHGVDLGQGFHLGPPCELGC